jgi:hypothetical protein
MNAFNPSFVSKPLSRLSSSLIGKNMGEAAGAFKERDAFYQLEVSGMQASDVKLDKRFNLDKKCGAKAVKFHDIKDEKEAVKEYDGKAPRLVNVKTLFN